MIPSLFDAKAHLRVSHEAEDQLIVGLIDAAVEHVEAITQRRYTGDGAEPMSASARQATLLLVGHLYENRQAASDKPLIAIPFAVEHLLWPLRRRVYRLGAS